MLQRNLLYTAVTRGREVVVIVGDAASIDRAVRTSRSGERVTRLRRLLRPGGETQQLAQRADVRRR